MKSFKLRHRIIVFSVSTIVLLSVAIVSVSLFRVRGVIREEFRERAESIARNLSQEAELGVLVENRKLLREQIADLTSVKDFVYVEIYNRKGELLAAKEKPPGRPGRGLLRLSLPVLVSSGEYPAEAGLSGESGGEISGPVKEKGGENIGRIEMGFSTETIRHTLFKITLGVVLVTVAFIVAGIFIAYLFSASLSRPISELVTATKKVAQGNLNYRIDIPPGDEIGELAGSFNKMTRDLKELTDGLEEKVRERTTELEQAYEKLKESAVKIQEADRMKSQFLTSMSHELRTPLNAILGFSGILLEGLEGELNEQVRQDLRLIENSGQHLLALINNILDLAKIEAGRMELRREEVEIAGVLEEALLAAQPLVGDRPIEVRKMVGDLPPVWVDRTKLMQILLNLLSNSFKFTDKGSVTVQAVYHNGEVVVSVADTGVGIKEEDQKRIFQEFSPLSASSPGTARGSGLGLAITRKLVEMHGGRIWLESEYGRGATFSFSLPVKETKGRGDG